MVTGQDGHIGGRAKPAPAPLVSQRIGPLVQLAETQRTVLVNQCQPVGVSSGSDRRRCPQQAIIVECAQHREDPTDRDRTQTPDRTNSSSDQHSHPRRLNTFATIVCTALLGFDPVSSRN